MKVYIMDDELKKLREEIEKMRKEIEELRQERQQGRERPPKTIPRRIPRHRMNIDEDDIGLDPDWGEALRESIMETIRAAFDGMNRAISMQIRGPPVRISARGIPRPPPPPGPVEDRIPRRIVRVSPTELVKVIAPLASPERLKILLTLDKYSLGFSEISEETGLKGGQLKLHLDKLLEIGYIIQERVRGRYLVSMNGRLALRLVSMLYRSVVSAGFLEDTEGKIKEEESNIEGDMQEGINVDIDTPDEEHEGDNYDTGVD